MPQITRTQTARGRLVIPIPARLRWRKLSCHSRALRKSQCVTLRASAISRGGVTTIINASTLKDKDYEEIDRRFRNRVRRRHRLRHDDRVEFTAGEGGHVLHCFYLRLTRMRRLMNVRLLTPRVDVRQRTWLASRPYNVTSAGYDNYMKLYIS
jgi:bifunctional DNA-binding transcriptional regulator/antitoxin component of YhaV-PrlF toxin-antitoxin module